MRSMKTSDDEYPSLYRVKFILLLFLQIPSIIVSLVIFFFYKKRPYLLKNIRHQSLLILLAVNFLQLTVDMPMPIHFYHLGYISPATSSYCTWWTFFEYNVEVISALLMCVISIQRHFLIFNHHLFGIPWKRVLLHHLPILVCVIYPITLYLVLIVFAKCDGTQWDYSSSVCGYANCHLVYSEALATFDWTAQNGLPTMIILFANIILLIRVIRQKLRFQRGIHWRKQRRMTLQLLSISILFLISWLPSLIIGLAQILFNRSFAVDIQKNYTIELIYLVCFFLPWISLAQLPRFKIWIRTEFLGLPDTQINVVRPA